MSLKPVGHSPIASLFKFAVPLHLQSLSSHTITLDWKVIAGRGSTSKQTSRHQ